MRTGTLFITFLLATACSGDDGGSSTTLDTASGPTSATASASDSATTTDSGTTDATASGTTAGTSTSDSGSSSLGTTTTATDGGSSGGGTAGDACEGKYHPGGFNSCIDENGNVDNKLCMWMGTGDTVGFVGCLNSASMDGANTCFISGCETDCDCFAPPADGTAKGVCGMILDGGGMGCALDCSNGETCPSGMECIDNLCFWPPKG